ncbi:unnamed protein product [Urochloa decumbens]|uniref:Uncharacterized protein n=1 Tax=Urochloa decumbens TaxID=240449 RepID=A0ABC9DU13_9POAL
MAASAERLVPMLAFCEAPFDRTSAPSPSSPARDAQLMEIAKEFAKPSSQRREQAQQQQEKAEAVDSLAIFETVVLQ